MELRGGYHIPYDPEPALQKLSRNRDEAMEQLWENLYHQGDVGTASYAAVPKLVEAGELDLVAAIEVARHQQHNPEIPESLVKSYEQALCDSLHSHPSTEDGLKAFYVIHASVHGQRRLAKALDLLCVEEIIAEYG